MLTVVQGSGLQHRHGPPSVAPRGQPRWKGTRELGESVQAEDTAGCEGPAAEGSGRRSVPGVSWAEWDGRAASPHWWEGTGKKPSPGTCPASFSPSGHEGLWLLSAGHTCSCEPLSKRVSAPDSNRCDLALWKPGGAFLCHLPGQPWAAQPPVKRPHRVIQTSCPPEFAQAV